jgi:hypothetical protein
MPRHIGAMVRQKIRHWENLGSSRATWYRRGKPTEPRKPPNTANMKTVADQAKTLGASSTRSYQRMMRVLSSDMAGYYHSGQLSIAKIDRLLGSPAIRAMVAAAKRKHDSGLE